MKTVISIVVPVYNTEKYIAETIESVLSQTYTNWELLLIDDGSTDNSKVIITKFTEQDERINYFYKKNGGQASARNLGIKKSNGEYIAFLDSDDIWLPKKLEHQVEDLVKYKPDFLYGLGYFYYPEKDVQLIEYEWITGERTGLEFFKVLYHSCAVNTNTVLVKKEIFNKYGFFDESEVIRGTEDWDLWMRIAKAINKVYGSPKRDVYYRIHDNGIHLQEARMKIGKINIYSKYDCDKTISRSRRLKEYRYCYRELFNHLYTENRQEEIAIHFKNYKKCDRFGVGKIVQQIIQPFVSTSTFIYLSRKLIYRVAYPMENIHYFFFLNE